MQPPTIPDFLFHAIDCLDKPRRMYAGPKQLAAIQTLTGKSLFKGENFLDGLSPEQLPELMRILCATEDPGLKAEDLEPYCCMQRLTKIFDVLGKFVSGETADPLSLGGPSAVSTSA